MPKIPFTGFIGPSYTLPSVGVDCQRSVNIYPELDELGTGKNHEVAFMKHTPGLKLITTAGIGPCRAAYKSSGGRLFFVSGAELYELVGDVETLRGTLDSASGPASLKDNGTQLVVLSGGKGWILTLSDNSFAQITDVNFPEAYTVDFLDQYMIVDDQATGHFQFSALADASDWNGLDLGTPEASPDKLITLCVDHQEVIFFSEQSTQFFFDSGDAYDPITARPGAVIERGIIGKRAFSKFDNRLGFWATDKDGGAIAFAISGYQAQRVSTNAIEAEIKNYGDLTDAVCWSYQDKGQTFWVTNFPNAKVTWVYNVANGLWHERSRMEDRSRAEYHVFDGSRHIVGDYENGNLYELSDTTYTENGELLPRIRRTPHVAKTLDLAAHYGFYLDMEVGVGNTSGDGSDPKAMLRWSDDGGHTWKMERTISIGKRGEYRKLVNWLRLGSSRNRVYELKITDPVPVTLISAFLDIQGLNA